MISWFCAVMHIVQGFAIISEKVSLKLNMPYSAKHPPQYQTPLSINIGIIGMGQRQI